MTAVLKSQTLQTLSLLLLVFLLACFSFLCFSSFLLLPTTTTRLLSSPLLFSLLPATNYGVFQKAIEASLDARQLQPEKIAILKIIQTYEVKLTRHGNMLIGASFAGKSVAWTVLQDAHALLNIQKTPSFEKVKTFIINPKSLFDAELYGQYDLATGEWLDGVLSNCMRLACADETPTLKWLILDGPVDTLWIESMNTVLDDNKLLTFVSGERISIVGGHS